ncbi:OsmC family protein [Zhihengliuella flava]|uniref:Organic hydroperoxide reductase OsmC/OhrA n=1 Tax=Zhihengliuella flava TaxID=1285193 RepID=A0A931D723_9MICC|nr:OsmC family protein [Zhihengliuella flava]MBG6083292.1 organic hydroperoxide reductase OsmC/OhrA [Zhihengliuella flava]
MNLSEHQYAVSLEWTGARTGGTTGYRDYGRDHVIRAAGLPDLPGTADPTFHGDRDRWNPEQLLLAALSQCHMLSYLHLAVKHGVVVTAYEDDAVGQLRLNRDGSGEFTSATVRPRVSLADESQRELANALHTNAHKVCFIARSVAFDVHHEPRHPAAADPSEGLTHE